MRLVHVWTLADVDSGANRGVGNQLTRRLLARGHEVWGTYRPGTKIAKDDESVKEVREVFVFFRFLVFVFCRVNVNKEVR